MMNVKGTRSRTSCSPCCRLPVAAGQGPEKPYLLDDINVDERPGQLIFLFFFLILKFCFLSLSLPLLSCFSSLLAVIQVGEKRLSDFGATQKRAEGSKKKKRERKKEKKEGRYVRIQASIIQVGD